MKPGVAVVGAGRMGSALASAFLKDGYETHVWNRTRSKLAPLGARGARIASSPQQAVAAADFVIVNLNDYLTTDGLLRSDGVAGALRGKLLVQLTSGSPRQAREMAAWAGQHDIRYLDGAIMATPNLIGGPECTILYSGPVELFEERKAVLATLGGNSLHVGTDVGHASALDSALLIVMWGALFGAFQGVAICRAENLRLDAYISYLEPVLPQVNGWVLDVVQRIKEGRLAGDETTFATLDSHYAAFRHLLELCRERGIGHAVPDSMDHLFQAAIKAGHAEDDFAVLHKFMR